MMDKEKFLAYVRKSQYGRMLTTCSGEGKIDQEASKLYQSYVDYQKGETNLNEFARQMDYPGLGLDIYKLKLWAFKLTQRRTECTVDVVEITPRTEGFEDEIQGHLNRGGQIRTIKGGSLYGN